MERESSINKQLRKEKTVRAVMNIKVKTLKVDIDENIIKIYDVDNGFNRIRKAMRRKKQNYQKYRELSARVNELRNIKIDLENKIQTLN